MQTFAAVAAVLILGGLRVAGEKAQWFQAAAHMLVAGLFVAWWCAGYSWHSLYLQPWLNRYFWFGVALTVVEVVCFVAGKL